MPAVRDVRDIWDVRDWMAVLLGTVRFVDGARSEIFGAFVVKSGMGTVLVGLSTGKAAESRASVESTVSLWPNSGESGSLLILL